ncbi:hypothetical protein D4S03_03980 [bacterium]|nr:MAG: hypothetical protein D4S03_03980 [bacterium]
MSPNKIQFLLSAAIALSAVVLSAGGAYGGIIILTDPNGQPLPVVIDPRMHGIIFTGPPRDNPSLVRRSINRAYNWSAYKGNAPMGGYYPYVYDPNDPVEIRNRAVVDYSLRRAQSYRLETNR